MAPKEKKSEIIDGYTIKYHANGVTRWSKGTLKRSGHFAAGEPVGEWITYDKEGKPYKVTHKG